MHTNEAKLNDSNSSDTSCKHKGTNHNQNNKIKLLNDEHNLTNFLKVNIPPPNPLPNKEQCLLNDPSKIVIKYALNVNINKTSKNNSSLTQNSNNINSSQYNQTNSIYKATLKAK